MRNFTYAFFSMVILILLLIIILPSMGYTLAPLASDAHQSIGQSSTNHKLRWVIDPDSPLYPIERDIEDLQLGFSFKNKIKEQLLIGFAQERAAESVAMVNKDNTPLAAQAVSEMVNDLQTLEEMKEYSDPQTVVYLEASILQIKKDSALAVADILNKSGETAGNNLGLNQPSLENIRSYVQADKDYHEAIEGLVVAKRDLDAAIASKHESAILAARESLEQAKEKVNEALDNNGV